MWQFFFVTYIQLGIFIHYCYNVLFYNELFIYESRQTCRLWSLQCILCTESIFYMQCVWECDVNSVVNLCSVSRYQQRFIAI